MKPEAQRIAIAEACGWEEIHAKPFTCNLHTHYELLFGYPRIDGGLCHEAEQLPDYLSNLNAMHEAENVLTKEQQRSFALILLGRQMGSMDYLAQDFRALHSKAAQRAEAFLRARGKLGGRPRTRNKRAGETK